MRVFLTRVFYDYAMSKSWKSHKNSDIELSDKLIDARDGHQVPIRLYRPKGSAAKKLPVIIYYHGGGFVIGSIKGYNNLCKALCEMNQCMLVSIDYRLAPEYPYPTPMHDSVDVTKWLFDNADSINANGKFILSGDSAGGNLAAVNIHKFIKDYPSNIVGQLLICPVTDLNKPHKQSFIDNAKVGPLTAGMMSWFNKNYTKNGVKENDVGIFPLKNENFTTQPPCLIYTCELDVLRDDGNLYADKLKAAGVDTIHVEQAGEVHNFPIGRNRTDNTGALAQIKQWTSERFAV